MRAAKPALAITALRANLSLMVSQQRQTDPDAGNFLEGKLLIALPGMPDPRFEKSVIFMCAHSLKTGSMGIIVNKPIEGLSFGEIVQSLDVEVMPQTPQAPVLYGGPVATGQGFVLHSGEYGDPQTTLPIMSGISLTTTVEILRAIAHGRGPRKSLFALGYSGWGPGQIEAEMQTNGWIHCDADAELVFGANLQSKWASALGRLGVDVSGLSAEAGRA
jgi:putative transcriptional regulator